MCHFGHCWLTLLAIAAMLGILAAIAFIPGQRFPLGAGVASLVILVPLFGLSRLRLGGPGGP